MREHLEVFTTIGLGLRCRLRLSKEPSLNKTR